MSTRRSINDDFSRLSSLRLLIETYEGIAAMTIRRIRNSVLTNREFYAGLAGIYGEVKVAYEEKIHSASVIRRIGQRDGSASLTGHNGKTVFVFLSANTGFYGDIISRTFNLFLESIRWSGGDCVVVGRVGKALLENALPGKDFTYFDFPDGAISSEQLKAISAHLHKYEGVVVFHGSFRSFIEQRPIFSRISGAESPLAGDHGPAVYYIFEPTLEDVAIFFESEIFASLLQQVFFESRLAKVASRLSLLDRASLNVDGALRSVSLKKRQVEHQISNRKQINSLSGVALWGGTRQVQ